MCLCLPRQDCGFSHSHGLGQGLNSVWVSHGCWQTEAYHRNLTRRIGGTIHTVVVEDDASTVLSELGVSFEVWEPMIQGSTERS